MNVGMLNQIKFLNILGEDEEALLSMKTNVSRGDAWSFYCDEWKKCKAANFLFINCSLFVLSQRMYICGNIIKLGIHCNEIKIQCEAFSEGNIFRSDGISKEIAKDWK